MLITEDIGRVHQILSNALEILITNRLSDGAFTDQEDVKSKSYFSTLEGLEAILIPFVHLPKNLYWDPLKTKYSKLTDLIIGDINFISRFNPKQELPPKDQGEPYFEQHKGPKRIPYWTSECGSFTLSVLTNLLLLRHQFGFPNIPKDAEIISIIETNLKWIGLCRRGKNGWSWTNESPVHHWPTWSLLDTYDEMLNCESLLGFHDSIEEECEEVTNTIIESFKKGYVAGSYSNDWNEKVLKSKVYDVETALDLTRLILAISLSGNPKIVKQLAKDLFSWASTSEFSDVDYSYHLSVKADYIYDSSLIPCVFRTLTTAAGILKPKKIKELDISLNQNHEIVINRVYSKLMENQINQGKYKGLWGVFGNTGLVYELYYTERVIEALVDFILYYDSDTEEKLAIHPSSKPTSVEPTKIDADDKAASSDGFEIYLPILDEVQRKLSKDNKSRSFKDSVIIFVLHFLNDLIPFVDYFYKFGCQYEDMYFLVKTYSYPEKEKLKHHFEDKKCNVFIPSDPHQQNFDKLAEDILQKSIERAEEQNKSILIIEDGGYISPLFHRGSFKNNIHKCCGAIEQTTKGYRRDLSISDPKFPICSIASSKLKMYLEAPEVAETLQENIINIIKKYGNKSPYKIQSLILGYGTIGSLLADSLFAKGVQVSVYDNDPAKRMQAELARKPYSGKVLDNLENINKFDVILGMSGETSLNEGEDFWNLKHNVILASGSSERIEFNLLALEELSKDVIREGVFTKYIMKKEDKTIRLLCDGEPINFALSSGISNLIIDPIYTEMFWSAVNIISDKDLNPGINEISVKVEEEVYRLYKKYHV